VFLVPFADLRKTHVREGVDSLYDPLKINQMFIRFVGALRGMLRSVLALILEDRKARLPNWSPRSSTSRIRQPGLRVRASLPRFRAQHQRKIWNATPTREDENTNQNNRVRTDRSAIKYLKVRSGPTGVIHISIAATANSSREQKAPPLEIVPPRGIRLASKNRRQAKGLVYVRLHKIGLGFFGPCSAH
jgi:hypothetical protein